MLMLQLYTLHLLRFESLSPFLEGLPVDVGGFAEAFVDLVLSTAQSACCTLSSNNLVTITYKIFPHYEVILLSILVFMFMIAWLWSCIG